MRRMQSQLPYFFRWLTRLRMDRFSPLLGTSAAFLRAPINSIVAMVTGTSVGGPGSRRQ